MKSEAAKETVGMAQPEAKEDDAFQWNGSKYAENSSPQNDRAEEALKKFGVLQGSGLDIGCGNGKDAGNMAEKIYPQPMWALDSSESMIEQAKKKYATTLNLTFFKDDATHFKFNKNFDFITSFFCLQWVAAANLPKTIENIYLHLKEAGRVCILVPVYDFPHEVIKGIAFSQKWQSHFKDFHDQQTFYPESFYKELFQKIGFEDLQIETVESVHQLTDEGFISYTSQWCGCYSWLKDETLKKDFIKDVKEKLATEKHDSSGKFGMVQKSIRIIAKKPTPTAVSTLTMKSAS